MAQIQTVNPVEKLRNLGIENPREVVQLVRQNFKLGRPVINPTPESARLANSLTRHIKKLYESGKIGSYDISKLNASEMNEVLSVVKKTARIAVPTHKEATVVTSNVRYKYEGEMYLPKQKMRHRYTLTLNERMDNPNRLYPGRLDPTSILSIQTGDSSPIRRTRPINERFKDAVKQFQARLKEAGTANFSLASVTRDEIKKAVPKVKK